MRNECAIKVGKMVLDNKQQKRLLSAVIKFNQIQGKCQLDSVFFELFFPEKSWLAKAKIRSAICRLSWMPIQKRLSAGVSAPRSRPHTRWRPLKWLWDALTGSLTSVLPTTPIVVTNTPVRTMSVFWMTGYLYQHDRIRRAQRQRLGGASQQYSEKRIP